MGAGEAGLSRRSVLTGQLGRRIVHISSAVVRLFRSAATRSSATSQRCPAQKSIGSRTARSSSCWKVASTGEIGSRLAAIALMDGVLAANLVFEQIDSLERRGRCSHDRCPAASLLKAQAAGVAALAANMAVPAEAQPVAGGVEACRSIGRRRPAASAARAAA